MWENLPSYLNLLDSSTPREHFNAVLQREILVMKLPVHPYSHSWSCVVRVISVGV